MNSPQHDLITPPTVRPSVRSPACVDHDHIRYIYSPAIDSYIGAIVLYRNRNKIPSFRCIAFTYADFRAQECFVSIWWVDGWVQACIGVSNASYCLAYSIGIIRAHRHVDFLAL